MHLVHRVDEVEKEKRRDDDATAHPIVDMTHLVGEQIKCHIS
jgi:hypothetical protein